MNFRKLLAFVLVFSLATQPCGVRFTYAEDTKAAEVKIEEKIEASDELAVELDETELDEYLFDPGSREQKLEEAATVAVKETAKTDKISGVLAGAIAAGVAAVTAVVGTAGLMIYNGVSNKDEIAKLWTSEEGSFFSRLGKTISILVKGANKDAGIPKQSLTGIDSYDNYLAGEAKLSVEGTTSTDDAEVYKEKERLAKEEAERKAKEEAEHLAKEKALLLENNKTVLRNGVNKLQGRIDALKEEHKGNLQDELNTVKNTIENATTVEELEGVEGQLTTLAEKVAEAEAAQQKAEDDARKLEELSNKKSVLTDKVTGLQSRIEALKEEHKGSSQDEFNTVKNTIENATTVEELAEVGRQLVTLKLEVGKLEGNNRDSKGLSDTSTDLQIPIDDSSQSDICGQDNVDCLYQKNENKKLLALREQEESRARMELQKAKLDVIRANKDNFFQVSRAVRDQIGNFSEENRSAFQEPLDLLEERVNTAESVKEIQDLLPELALLAWSIDEAKKKGSVKNNNVQQDNNVENQSEQNDSNDSEEGSSPENSLEGQINDNQTQVISETQEEPEVKKQETDEIVQDEKQVDNIENNTVQQDTNEGSNSREENPTTIAVEEKKEPFVGPLPKKVHDLIEKKNSALNTLNKLENTCGLDTVGFKSELNALALETLTTDEEFAQAEEKLNSIINRVNTLGGECSDIKSKKGYIEENWKTVDSTLDQSDCSLRNEWNKLKELLVTEDNLESLANKYYDIAYRVKLIIDNNNAIPKLTDKISKVIEDNKNAAWIDKDYYNEQLDNLSKKAKTEASLAEILEKLNGLSNELQNNYSKKEIKAVSKALVEIDNSAFVKGTCTQSSWGGLKKENKLTSEPCNTLKDKFVAKRDRLVEEAKSSHSLVGLAQKLKNLYDNTDEYINDVADLNADADKIEEIINEAGKFGLIDKDYSLENLQTKRTAMKAFLNELQKDYSKKEIEAVNKALDEIDNSAIVKGACTQSRLFGWKEENKLTSEQCNTLKDKFVAERDRLVEEAKSSYSVVGLAEKLKNLYDNTDEYINDVAELNADADKIEEIIAKAKELDLIDAEYVNSKLNGNKEYSLDDLKTKREAMTELLNSLSTYTSDNLRDIGAILDLIKDTLSDEIFTIFKKQSKKLNSEVDAAIADIKSAAKQKCSLDGVINSLNSLSDLCKDTVSNRRKYFEEHKKFREISDGDQYKRSQYKKMFEDLKAKFDRKEISFQDVVNRLEEFNQLMAAQRNV